MDGRSLARILLAEDRRNGRRHRPTMLRSGGHDVAWAKHGTKRLSLQTGEEFDLLVFCDVTMPRKEASRY